MQISDLLLRTGLGSSPVEHPGDPSGSAALRRARLQALLPASGIVVAPPESEDRLEISPLAHAILRAGEELDAERWERVEALRTAYLRNEWDADAEAISAILLPGLSGTSNPEERAELETDLRSRIQKQGR